MSVRPWVLATRNAGKLRELRPLFTDAGVTVIDLCEAGLPETSEEDGLECYDTFEENALAKARWFADRVGGLPVVADDSGLVVGALDGAPGVRSKRWSGGAERSGDPLDAANNALLLQRMRGVSDRRAKFVCAAAWHDGARELVALGEVAGVIVQEGAARGAHGFGYDPLFLADELGLTLAEATVAEKQAVSHRGRAFTALLQQFRQLTAHR